MNTACTVCMFMFMHVHCTCACKFMLACPLMCVYENVNACVQVLYNVYVNACVLCFESVAYKS